LPPRDYSAEDCYVGVQRYVELLARMSHAASNITPRVDCVVGAIRSGLFPAAYLSHQFDWPLFTSADAKRLPIPRLARPLIVDTTCWSGGTLRRLVHRLERLGAKPEVLVMFARADPIPAVDRLNYLELSARIPRFWYEEPGGADEELARLLSR
jgi:hypothetical protein